MVSTSRAPGRHVAFGLYLLVLGLSVLCAVGLLLVSGGSSGRKVGLHTLPVRAPTSPAAETAPRQSGGVAVTPLDPMSAAMTSPAPSLVTTAAPATTTPPQPVASPIGSVPVTVYLAVDPQSGQGCTAGITGRNQWIKYVVQRGDTLSAISRCFDLNGYQALYQQNASLIGDNPNLIFPGQVFTIVNGVMTAASSNPQG